MCNGNSSRPSHVPSLPSLVPCRDCHRTTCFGHLLGSSAHAVEALLLCNGENVPDRATSKGPKDNRRQTPAIGKGAGPWHEWHCKAKTRLKSANAPGSEEFHHFLFRLLRAAQTYSTFRPVDEARTELGWYDRPFVVRCS